MKHLYRIGIFAAACAVIAALVWFLFGQFRSEVRDMGDYPQIYADQKEKEYREQLEAEGTDPDASQTAAQKEFINRQTVYVVEEYDSYSDSLSVSVEELPGQYLGMTREELEEELRVYANAPSLQDVSKGLTGVVLESFSSEKITIRKIYYLEPEPECYLLTLENQYVVVYYKNLDTLYCHTDIPVENLPERVQEEVMQIKRIETEAELFTFLESYSS